MTTIEKIVYGSRYISLYLDDGEVLKLSLSAVQGHTLEKGRALEPLEYRQLKEESEYFTCLDKGYAYLAVRARSQFEMERYFKRKNFSPHIIQQVVGKLKDAGYLNDYEYARAFIRGRLKKKAMGERMLRKELAARGIPRNIMQKVLKEPDVQHVDEDRVYESARKKYDSYRGKGDGLQRVYRFLAGRGFSGDIIKRVVRRISEEEGREENGFSELE